MAASGPAAAPAAAARKPPLAVDMDGTLLLSDTLLELFVAGLRRRPFKTIMACAAILRGKAALKRAIVECGDFEIDHVPVREDFLAHLEAERNAGRSLHLVSAADQAVVDRVAARFGIFESAHGSHGETNLKGGRKLAFLRERFGRFAYAGDASCDLEIWREADGIVIAGASRRVTSKARRLGPPVEAEFNPAANPLRTWVKALRMHQWSKNGLMFIPLLLGLNATKPAQALVVLAGFVLAGVAASATYIINDLADLAADRQHRSKRRRPLASGRLPLAHALVAAPLMLLAAFAGALALSPIFALVLGAYLVTTLSYSFWLKRAALIDVVTLAGLYTLRIVMGTVLAASAFSPWLLTFSAFFFFSMSLAKRHVEVGTATGDPNKELPGRGYRPADAPLTLAFGAAASTAAVLIMVQYMMADAFPSGVYDFPVALWAAPILVGLWICRIWLLAQRGELNDDPVAFAVKDKVSLGMGVVLFIAFALARFRFNLL